MTALRSRVCFIQGLPVLCFVFRLNVCIDNVGFIKDAYDCSRLCALDSC